MSEAALRRKSEAAEWRVVGGVVQLGGEALPVTIQVCSIYFSGCYPERVLTHATAVQKPKRLALRNWNWKERPSL